jgi:DNA-binding CsgD family transcriptional regulator
MFQRMATLARGDLDAVLRFVYDATTTERERPFTPDLLAGLHELVPGADCAYYLELDWSGRRIRYWANGVEWGEDGNGDEVWWRLHHQHAVCHHFMTTNDLRPRKMSDLLQPREWRARELYVVNNRPYQYELDFGLAARRGYAKIFFFRASRRDFSARDRLVLEVVRPILQQIDETYAMRRRVTDGVPLTRREREIIGWVDRGKTNSEIAQILWISPATVRKHLENAYEKLGVRTRTAAVARLRGA